MFVFLASEWMMPDCIRASDSIALDTKSVQVVLYQLLCGHVDVKEGLMLPRSVGRVRIAPVFSSCTQWRLD